MQRTKIEYLSHTWNPLAMRCTRVSAGCANCWHIRMANRLRGYYYKMPAERINCYAKYQAYNGGDPWLNAQELAAPLKRRKPAIIGVQFMGDLFHSSVTNEQIAAVFGVMAACLQHTFCVLTKRPERMHEWFEWLDVQAPKSAPSDSWEPWWRAFECVLCLHDQSPINRINLDGLSGATWPLPNVMLGVSVEDQATADERIPWLLKTPTAKRFVSCEPLLGPIYIGCYLLDPDGLDIRGGWPQSHDGLDWIITGAETGPGKRPMNIEWARSLGYQCAAANVPFFFKVDSAGNHELDGRIHEEMPETGGIHENKD